MSECLAKELMLPLTEKKVGNAVSLANGTIVRSGHHLAFRYSIGPFSEIEFSTSLTWLRPSSWDDRGWIDNNQTWIGLTTA
jgi:hypothetical protein